MDKTKRSQILKLSIIASLFITTPIIPTKFRSTYLYFIFNLLIVALGAEAGLVSFFSKPNEDKKQVNTIVTTPPVIQGNDKYIHESEEIVKPKESVTEKVVVSKVKKCPSTPSIFFIGNCENVREEIVIEEDEEEVISGQELFAKAEMFIGDFYKQLKMQRQDSMNRIHGFYQKLYDHGREE